MMKKLDINQWNRKAHFDFFKAYDQPFFGITAMVDVTKAYRAAKQQQVSFFLYYLHKALLAINSIEEFRYRITQPNEVIIFDAIRAGATINRPDGTFSFSYLDFYPEFNAFNVHARSVIDEIRKTSGLPHTDRSQDVAYFSAIPWLKFTAIEHAMNSRVPDSVPKIAFGKYEEQNGCLQMPVAVHVHHALMDGVHVARYFELLQQLLNG